MSAETHLVSVVVPTYNNAGMLGRALESLIAQDYPAVEVIVVDDGSTDETATIVGELGTGVLYLRQENQGPSAARNAGIAAANGEFVAFLDSDDVAPPDKLSNQLRYLHAHPEVGCVLGRQRVIDDGENELPGWLSRDPVFGDLAGVPLMSMVARRATLLELGGFDVTLRVAEDRDLLVRMRAADVGIGVVPDVVLIRTFHERNLSHDRPEHHPLLRSLKTKLERERTG